MLYENNQRLIEEERLYNEALERRVNAMRQDEELARKLQQEEYNY